MTPTESIVAIATANGRGAIGIVRVSGPAAGPVMQAVCGRAWPARQAGYGPFRDAAGEAIDHGVAIYFAGPASATGEDVLELQAHGGPVVLQMLQRRCLEAAAAAGVPLRLAEPGEFTLRAFLNDRMDLAQAEGVADLIDASTEAAARASSRAMEGAFAEAVAPLRTALVELRALVEATLDFPEEDIEFIEQAQVAARLGRLAEQLAGLRARTRQGALLREGLTVVLAGAPNVGKSSLLNALAGADVAIVTPLAGTTRDRLRETIQIDGVPLHVIDTAGLRDTEDAIERIGVARSWEAIARADVVLVLHDAARAAAGDAVYQAEQAAALQGLDAHGVPAARRLHVVNKMDLVATPGAGMPLDALPISVSTGVGLDALRARLLALGGWAGPQGLPEAGVFSARARHVAALDEAAASLATAREALALQGRAVPLDLLAEDLRQAHQALGAILGVMTPDALLGEIFGRFCIGK